jgi:hypothetical protein
MNKEKLFDELVKEGKTIQEVADRLRECEIVKPENEIVVIMVSFTGMRLGIFKAIQTGTGITVTTNKGELKFDPKTGIQINAKSTRFANRLSKAGNKRWIF